MERKGQSVKEEEQVQDFILQVVILAKQLLRLYYMRNENSSKLAEYKPLRNSNIHPLLN